MRRASQNPADQCLWSNGPRTYRRAAMSMPTFLPGWWRCAESYRATDCCLHRVATQLRDPKVARALRGAHRVPRAYPRPCRLFAPGELPDLSRLDGRTVHDDANKVG